MAHHPSPSGKPSGADGRCAAVPALDHPFCKHPLHKSHTCTPTAATPHTRQSAPERGGVGWSACQLGHSISIPLCAQHATSAHTCTRAYACICGSKDMSVCVGVCKCMCTRLPPRTRGTDGNGVREDQTEHTSVLAKSAPMCKHIRTRNSHIDG